MVSVRTNTNIEGNHDDDRERHPDHQASRTHYDRRQSHENRHDTRKNHKSKQDDDSPPTADRVALVRWTAGLGAVTAEAVAVHLDVSPASARGRLRAAEGEQLVKRCRPLTGHPALYTVSRGGLRKVDMRGLDPCKVSASNALHLIECARVAAVLERCYPDHRVQGERELRSEERERHRALASAELGVGLRGVGRHRPDLVLWPLDSDGALPVAVEVELTVKAPERLAAICRAWARARCVAGVLYLAPPEVERAVRRAIDRAQAHQRVVVVPLETLPGSVTGPAERTVPSSA
jgi:hypothetical protein